MEGTEGRGSIAKHGEYIWMNIWCMLDLTLSQKLQKYAPFAYRSLTGEERKKQDAVLSIQTGDQTGD